MVPLTRGDEPEVLRLHAMVWTDELIEARRSDPSARPQTRRYGHPTVREALRAMSRRKCFYCESAVAAGQGEEVDHHIESSLQPELAYAWTNLYLSCHGCNNGKPTHDVISVRGCVDPCDASQDPSAHLMFDKGLITEVPGSIRGATTVRKYRLDRPDLDLARLKLLNRLKDEFTDIVAERARAPATTLSEAHRRRLLVFANPSRPFAAMMKAEVQRILDAFDGR